MGASEFMVGGFRAKPAWHKDGRQIILGEDEYWDNATDAAVRTGVAEHRISKRPFTVTLDDGTTLESDEHFALVQEPMGSIGIDDYRILRTVGRQYKVVDVGTICKIVDPISTPEKWPVETIGLLGSRTDRFLLTLKMDQFRVGGYDKELHQEYLFVAQNWRAGAISIMYTLERVVCRNTYASAFAKSQRLLTVPHTGDPEAMLELRIALENAVMEAKHDAVAQLELMIKHQMTMEEMSQVLEAAYPIRPAPEIIADFRRPEVKTLSEELQDNAREAAAKAEYNWNHECKRMHTRRTDVMQTLELYNAANPQIANTAYTFLNALNEYADFRPGRGDVARQLLDPNADRYKEKQWAAESVMALVGGSAS